MVKFELDDPFYEEIVRLTNVYYHQAEICRKSNAYLAGCVMIGAALEATLMAVANIFPEEVGPSPITPRRGGSIKPLSEWTLSELLAVAKDRNWLPSALSPKDDWDDTRAEIGDYAEVLRQIRNLIHPARYASDLPRKRITKKYLESSFEILEVATEYLRSKVLNSLRSLIDEEESATGA